MEMKNPNDNDTAENKADQISQGSQADSDQPEIGRLRDENDRLRQELARTHEAHIRNLADFDNYRRRIERERAQMGRAGKRELVLPLLGVLDDFDRALLHSGQEPQSIIEGVKAIYRRLTDLLAAQGVVAFESAGQRFNPARHEAVSLVESDKAEPGVVIDEVSRGYQWGDELLRPARVRVTRER